MRARILVVDDDDEVRSYTRTILESHGFSVHDVCDGVDAMAAIPKYSPDLLLMDIDMPRMNGFELCKSIRADLLLEKLPVIFMTGTRKAIEDRIEGLEIGSDDYMLKPFDPSELIVRIKTLLRRSATYLDANPLTHLPGNGTILREAQYRIDQNQKFTWLYIDLSNFKAFNDRYGFMRGNQVILFVARLLLKTMMANHGKNEHDTFVGHVGGDDFVMITAPEHAENLCRTMTAEFDGQIVQFYDPEDLQKGGIEAKDRGRNSVFFPIMKLTIAGVTNTHRNIRDIEEISTISAQVKAYVKKMEKSAFAIDRRTGKDSEDESKRFIF